MGDALSGGRPHLYVYPLVPPGEHRTQRLTARAGSHKRRDNRCHIAAPLLRSAFITCLSKYDINVDETGQSLCGLPDGPLEELKGDQKTREAEVDKRVRSIEGVEGGNGGEVGIFNINHLGGHRYSGVLLVSFPCAVSHMTHKHLRYSSPVVHLSAMVGCRHIRYLES